MERRVPLFVLMPIVLLVGCGGGETVTTSAATGATAGAGGSGGSTTSTGTGAAAGSAGTGSAACDAKLDGDCGACMKEQCCVALVDCESDADCLACVTGQDGEACEANETTHKRVDGFLTCKGGACQAACIGGPNEGCEGAMSGLVAAACQECLEQQCCGEVAACKANDGCWQGCVVNFSEASCHADPDGHALFHAFGECVSTKCNAPCAAPKIDAACDAPVMAASAGACITIGGDVACNPVTNEGCSGAGQACDAKGEGFACFPPPNENAVCEACSMAEGYCASGHFCAGGTCVRYCCDNGDCGTGVCDKTLLKNPSVGLCVKATP